MHSRAAVPTATGRARCVTPDLADATTEEQKALAAGAPPGHFLMLQMEAHTSSEGSVIHTLRD